MNPEDNLAAVNCRVAKIRRYWSRRGERIVRHWLRKWLLEVHEQRRSLMLYDPEELSEGMKLFKRSTYIDLVSHAS